MLLQRKLVVLITTRCVCVCVCVGGGRVLHTYFKPHKHKFIYMSAVSEQDGDLKGFRTKERWREREGERREG